MIINSQIYFYNKKKFDGNKSTGVVRETIFFFFSLTHWIIRWVSSLFHQIHVSNLLLFYLKMAHVQRHNKTWAKIQFAHRNLISFFFSSNIWILIFGSHLIVHTMFIHIIFIIVGVLVVVASIKFMWFRGLAWLRWCAPRSSCDNCELLIHGHHQLHAHRTSVVNQAAPSQPSGFSALPVAQCKSIFEPNKLDAPRLIKTFWQQILLQRNATRSFVHLHGILISHFAQFTSQVEWHGYCSTPNSAVVRER